MSRYIVKQTVAIPPAFPPARLEYRVEFLVVRIAGRSPDTVAIRAIRRLAGEKEQRSGTCRR